MAHSHVRTHVHTVMSWGAHTKRLVHRHSTDISAMMQQHHSHSLWASAHPSGSKLAHSGARRVHCKGAVQDQHQSTLKRAFVFGLGYTTLGLANLLKQAGWHVTATYRTPKAHEAILSRGWQAVEFDPCSEPGKLKPELLQALESCSHVLSSIPPVGLPLYDPVLQAQLKALKQMNTHNLQWLGYLSSTGVYGDHAGEWVDEQSTCQPRAARGYVRYEHELAWSKVCTAHHLPLHIFRLGGIYGPGRSLLSSGPPRSSRAGATRGAAAGGEGPSSSKQRRGQQKYISRIHVYDICQQVMASMQAPHGSSSTSDSLASPLGVVHVYNLVDDEPASRSTVLQYVRGLQQGDVVQQASPVTDTPPEPPRPPPAPEAAPSGSKGGGNAEVLEEKRVRNNKMKQELSAQLEHPTYREGMTAIMSGDIRPFTQHDLEFLGLAS